MTVGWCQSNIVSDDVVASLRVVVAEDDVLLREGLASLFERAGFACCRAGRRRRPAAHAGPRQARPIWWWPTFGCRRPRRTEGLDAARAIREEFPDTGILVLSAPCRGRARDGAAGYRPRGSATCSRPGSPTWRSFIDTLERIAKGASVVRPGAGAGTRCRPVVVTIRWRVLSAREREVLGADGGGTLRTPGSPVGLWITERTVEKHVRSILTKLALPRSGDDQRRVLAVITFLDAR